MNIKIKLYQGFKDEYWYNGNEPKNDQGRTNEFKGATNKLNHH